jgi:uncharacterized protein
VHWPEYRRRAGDGIDETGIVGARRAYNRPVDWLGRRESDEIEDRRGFGLPGGRVGVGGCGLVVIAIVIGILTGNNPLRILQLLTSSAPSTEVSTGPSGGAPSPAEEDPDRKFVSVVLADTEDTWTEIFARQGRRYERPKLVLFSGATQTACGFGSAATGPFYCPDDRRVYLDLSFFQELSRRFGAPGEFARAYVIAHEVGHHVQTLLGIEGEVQDRRGNASERQANRLSVGLELQADCFAGVWGNSGARRGLVRPGEADEGLRAAAALGDDRLQRMRSGYVQPETFTHGTSAQRAEWFKRGLDSGDPGACKTF